MKKPTKVAIDSDLLAYRSAAAVEKRSIIATHKASNNKKPFDNRSAFWGRGKNIGGWLGDKNEELLAAGKPTFSKEDFEIEDVREVEPLVNALHIAKTTIQNICKSCNVSEYVLVLETDESVNFRNEVATIHKYKDREGEKPTLLYEVKKYLIEKHPCIIAGIDDELESDDHLSILASSGEYIQASLDKDADQCGGSWKFDWVNMQEPEFIPKGIGSIWLNEKREAKARGLKALCKQLLTGDSVDSIFPTRLCNASFGDVSAFNILEMLKTPKQCLSVVVACYQEWYPDPVEYPHWETGELITKDWLGIAEEIFALLWMKRRYDDTMTFKKLLGIYEVDYGKN